MDETDDSLRKVPLGACGVDPSTRIFGISMKEGSGCRVTLCMGALLEEP